MVVQEVKGRYSEITPTIFRQLNAPEYLDDPIDIYHRLG